MNKFWRIEWKNWIIIPTVLIPTTIMVSCSASVPSLKWDKTKALVDEIKGEDFLKKIQDLGIKEKSILTNIEYQSSFFLYDKEQKGSIELQKMFFEWKIFATNQEIVGITNNAYKEKPTKNEEKIIEEKKKDIKKNEDKLKNINAKLLDYDSSSFASDYSKILLPQSKIKNKQTKIFNDQKDNYIEQFATKANGEEQWPKYRRNTYNGAITDDEAIIFLVYQKTQSIAFSRFNFKLNTTFTKEMAQAVKITTKGKKWQATPIFTFLKDAKFKTPLIQNIQNNYNSLKKQDWKKYQRDVFEDEDKASKAYFVSSNTKVPSQMHINPSVQTNLLTQKIIQVQNVMLPGKQNNKNPMLPWTMLAEKPSDGFTARSPIKRIFHSYNNNKILGQSLAPLLFKDQDATKKFVKYFSNTLDGTRTKSGKLGIQTTIQYVKNMVPAFGFGILRILGNKNIELPKIKLSKIFKAYNDGKKDLMAKYKILELKSNEEIDRLIDSATDEEINKIFGQKIRDLFDPSISMKGIPLVYKLDFENKDNTTNAYVVVSEKFGIHIIHINEFTNANPYSRTLNDDLAKLAKQQKPASDSETLIWTIYTKYYNQTHKLDVITKMKKTKNAKSFEEYFKANYKEGAIKAQELLKNGKELILSIINSEASTLAKDAIGNKIKSWYINQLDLELRKVETTLEPNDFYKWAYKLAGGQ